MSVSLHLYLDIVAYKEGTHKSLEIFGSASCGWNAKNVQVFFRGGEHHQIHIEFGGTKPSEKNRNPSQLGLAMVTH